MLETPILEIATFRYYIITRLNRKIRDPVSAYETSARTGSVPREWRGFICELCAVRSLGAASGQVVGQACKIGQVRIDGILVGISYRPLLIR